MHAVLITIVALGAGADGSSQRETPAKVVQAGYNQYADGNCQSCQGGGHHGGVDKRLMRSNAAIGRATSRYSSTSHMMPQTCYAPRYGCYYGNNRHMHRHTAFHGNYYRNPYNYRHYFEYPWHAEPHEPTSLYSYNSERQYDVREVNPTPAPAPTLPGIQNRDAAPIPPLDRQAELRSAR